MRLLAAVPSVIYGLIGILVLVPVRRQPPDQRRARRSRSPTWSSSTAPASVVAVLILTVMITPIMIAIIVDALRAVPRLVDGGRARRSASTAGARCGRSPCARRGPAIVAAAVLATARALGEAIMLSMVSGLGRLRAQPARRPHLLLRAGAAAGGDDRRQRRGPVGRRRSARRSTRSRRCCSSRALFLSLAGWAAQAAAAKYGVRRDEAPDASAADALRPPRPAPRRRRDALGWRRRDRIGARRCAGPPGILLCADRRRDRALHARARAPVPEPGPALRRTRVPDLDQSEDRRLPRPADRHAAS